MLLYVYIANNIILPHFNGAEVECEGKTMRMEEQQLQRKTAPEIPPAGYPTQSTPPGMEKMDYNLLGGSKAKGDRQCTKCCCCHVDSFLNWIGCGCMSGSKPPTR
ncbi:unnamed protein product [Cuscuta europaea]|uniref:Uncharacterized protein n=1 Tax=Cuscuta europaea TaxID=41803 RepID=A0A9P0YKG1_CUSEU|nr:unnamed protein product [Cuscuta europaea]